MALEQVFAEQDSEDEVDDDVADLEDRRVHCSAFNFSFSLYHSSSLFFLKKNRTLYFQKSSRVFYWLLFSKQNPVIGRNENV